MRTFCILLSAPRSGTTMLGDAVSRSFAAAWPQEVFHSDHADPSIDFKGAIDIRKRCNFFNFRYELFKQRPALSYPSVDNQSLIFDLYLEYLVSSEQADRYFLDIKYTSWHHLNDYWWSLNQSPQLFRDVTRLKLPIVHLKRSNLFSLYCSQRLAMETGMWSKTEDQTASNAHLIINMRHCLPFLEGIRATERLFDQWLEGYPDAFRDLRYETLLVSGEFSKGVEQTFAEIYGMTALSPLSTVYRKVTPPLRDVVENKDEVLTGLRETDFLVMAEEAMS